MKSGVGSVAIELPGGLIVAALVVANAVGDVIDPATGKVVAGVRTEDGMRLADARRLLLSDAGIEAAIGENTTLGVIATNATLTKTQAKRVAQVAHDGLARAIYPSHTPGDGDTLFVLATGSHQSTNVGTVGALAAEVVAQAVLRGVRAAEGLPGLPAARDLTE